MYRFRVEKLIQKWNELALLNSSILKMLTSLFNPAIHIFVLANFPSDQNIQGYYYEIDKFLKTSK